MRCKREIDADFDARANANTGGYTSLAKLAIKGRNRNDGVHHVASDPAEFDAAMSSITEDLSNYTFVDLGAGKGRAMMLASRYPFAKIIGVEFAEELIAEARENLARFSLPDQRCTAFECIHGDATEYDLPDTDVVVFLYNPFNARIMDIVAKRTRESLMRSPRRALIVYDNPFQRQSWLAAGFEEVRAGATFSILALPR